MKKILFFALWILSIIVFVSGQILAPPNYHLNQNGFWSMLFGITAIIGVMSFVIMVALVVTEKPAKTKSKYNLSIKHITTRFILSSIMIVIFGIALIPFLTQADGLLFEQRAAIGTQNMYRVIILWALFTALYSIISFNKKRFRMVSVILIVCWVIGTSFVAVVEISDRREVRCRRAAPYQMPLEELNKS